MEQIECKKCKQIKERIHCSTTADGKTRYYKDSTGSYWQSPRVCPDCFKANRKAKYEKKKVPAPVE